MQHLDEGEIHAWLDGALSPAEGARLEAHIATCKECAAMVADARGLIAGAARIVSALDHVPAGVIPKSTPAAASRPLWRVLHLTPFRAAMAASLMVAAASLFALGNLGGDKITVPETMQKLALPAAAPAPAPRALEDSSAVASQPKASPNTVRALAAPKPVVAQDRAEVVAKSANEPKKERDAALKVAAPAAPPASANAGALAQAREPMRDSARDMKTADIVARRGLPPAVQRASVAAFSQVAPVSFVGCYQVVDTAAWPAPLPRQFQLLGDVASGAENVRVGDSTVGNWRGIAPSVMTVRVRSVEFTLSQTADGYAAVAASQPSRTVRVARLDCAR